MAGRPGAKFDLTLFQQWSPEMAWALGLLFTDGHLRPAVGHTAATLCFTQKSPELHEKLKALMHSNTVVYSNPRRVYNGKTAGATFRFAISNARLGQRMLELGLTPRKSLTMRFPPVPLEYVRHFVRGCWDGDGTVYRETDGRRIVAKFGCGSQRFVEEMLAALYRDGFPERRVYRLKRGGCDVEYYYFVFQRPPDIELLFHYLYHGVSADVYLARKYELFAAYMATRASRPLVDKPFGSRAAR